MFCACWYAFAIMNHLYMYFGRMVWGIFRLWCSRTMGSSEVSKSSKEAKEAKEAKEPKTPNSQVIITFYHHFICVTKTLGLTVLSVNDFLFLDCLVLCRSKLHHQPLAQSTQTGLVFRLVVQLWLFPHLLTFHFW